MDNSLFPEKVYYKYLEVTSDILHSEFSLDKKIELLRDLRLMYEHEVLGKAGANVPKML